MLTAQVSDSKILQYQHLLETETKMYRTGSEKESSIHAIFPYHHGG